jgi:hypothetical protein
MLQRARLSIMFAVFAICLSASAAESTVYKVVDPEGRVTYQDHPPEPGTPAVERLQLRPDQNVLESAPQADEAPPANQDTASDAVPPPSAPQTQPRSPEVRRQEAAAIVEKALQANDALDEESPEGASGAAAPETAADSP